MNQRIIICGPAASGKDFLKKKFKDRGFKLDVSYTTRPIRKGEKEEVDYCYISEDEFKERISHDSFYEWAQHGMYKYGTGWFEWDNRNIFIMETHGVSKIIPEDRKNCFIIYLNPPCDIRENRLREDRGWNTENIKYRTKMDNEKFSNFKDYDIQITNPYF